MTPVELPEIDCLDFITTHLYFGPLNSLGNPPSGKTAVFYGIGMRNVSDFPVRIMGRKWIYSGGDHQTEVVEGDQLFGTRPLLQPDQIFAINGYYPCSVPARISLTLIGRGDDGHIFRTPPYRLVRSLGRRS